MKSRRKTLKVIVLTSLMALVLFSIAWAIGLVPSWSAIKLERALAGIASRSDQPVFLHEITDFNWDTVCAFSGSDSPPAPEELRGAGILTIPARYKSSIDWLKHNSDIRMLIFGLRGKVVDVAYFPGSSITLNGRRFDLKAFNCLGVSQALFRIEHVGENPKVWLSTQSKTQEEK